MPLCHNDLLETVVADEGQPTGRIVQVGMPGTGPNLVSAAPILRVLTPNERLFEWLCEVMADLDVKLSREPGDGPQLIDPEAGVHRVREHLAACAKLPPCAVIVNRSYVQPLFLAFRLSHARPIPDPRTDPSPLRRFIEDTLALKSHSDDRRAYPRSGRSGIELLAPEAELIDLSPYGARIRMASFEEGTPMLRLRLLFTRTRHEEAIDCQVVGEKRRSGYVDVRLRFVQVDSNAQKEMFRIAKAHLLCETITSTFYRCEHGDVEGYRRLANQAEVRGILGDIVADQSAIVFSRMRDGRVLTGTARELLDKQRRLLVDVGSASALGAIGDHVCLMTTARHRNIVFDGYVLSQTGKIVSLTWPTNCVQTDLRAQERVYLGLDSPLSVEIDGLRYSVTDVSPRGFSFYSPEPVADAKVGRPISVAFDLGAAQTHKEVALLRHHQPNPQGGIMGATFIAPTRAFEGDLALEERHYDLACLKKTRRVEHAKQGQLVDFPSGDRKISGIWIENMTEGAALLVVVPPAWAKTKESTSLLAQVLCSSFDAAGRRIAVLRIDYSNALGASHKDAEFREPGKESLGLTFSACIDDIRAAITYAHARLGTACEATALIGMSFSGPLCLRVAADDTRVTELVELMGASDIQDLVRTSTGGIDYISNYRAGLRDRLQNVLGLLSDTDRWVGDGIRSRLVFLQDAQADAARLRIPLLWVHGKFDGFISEDRVRSILDAAVGGERYLATVDCGHVPTKSSEAVLACMPVVDFLLRRNAEQTVTVAPTDACLAQMSRKEWAEAPKATLRSPRDFWREYMLGTTEDDLGFDVLAMTREYQELMELQIQMLTAYPGQAVHDLGAGAGHALRFLSSVPGGAARWDAYDLVPELLKVAEARAADLGASIATYEWDGEAIPNAMRGATRILMSLFLSCLPDPARLLGTLAEWLPQGAQIVASSIRPDADLSGVYTRLLKEIGSGTISAPKGYGRKRFLQAVRGYMNSAAWLLRLADQGTFHLYEQEELAQLFIDAGFTVVSTKPTFGQPPRAIIVVAEKLA